MRWLTSDKLASRPGGTAQAVLTFQRCYTMEDKLTAEAFGTLLALSDLGRVRILEPWVHRELVARGFAEDAGDGLRITPPGRRFAQTRNVRKALGLAPPLGR